MSRSKLRTNNHLTSPSGILEDLSRLISYFSSGLMLAGPARSGSPAPGPSALRPCWGPACTPSLRGSPAPWLAVWSWSTKHGETSSSFKICTYEGWWQPCCLHNSRRPRNSNKLSRWEQIPQQGPKDIGQPGVSRKTYSKTKCILKAAKILSNLCLLSKCIK